MKRLKILLLVFIVLLITAGGFFLPNGLQLVQDRRLNTKVSIYETEHIQVNTTEPILGSLKLISGQYYSVPIEKGEKMTDQKIYKRATRFITRLRNKGFFSYRKGDILAYAIKPCLAMSSETLTNSIFWDCQLIMGDERELNFIFDDFTGKVISFNISHDLSNQSELISYLLKSIMMDHYEMTITNTTFEGNTLLLYTFQSSLTEDQAEISTLVFDNYIFFNSPFDDSMMQIYGVDNTIKVMKN